MSKKVLNEEVAPTIEPIVEGAPVTEEEIAVVEAVIEAMEAAPVAEIVEEDVNVVTINGKKYIQTVDKAGSVFVEPIA